MRIVSLNTWCGRLDNVPEYLASLAADVLCLQEVTAAPPHLPDRLYYEGNGSTPELQRTKFLSELKAALPQYQCFYHPACRGYLHDGAKTHEPVFYGIATFVRNEVPVIAQQAGFVHDHYRPFAWGDPPLPRTAHAVRMFDYGQDCHTTVAHMHGMWLRTGKHDAPERTTQATRFAEIIAKTAGPTDRIVACGDWNVMPESETLRILERSLGLKDLVTSCGHTDTRTSYYKKNPRYADYMMVTRHVEEYAKSFDVPAKPEVSDHRPLILDFD